MTTLSGGLTERSALVVESSAPAQRRLGGVVRDLGYAPIFAASVHEALGALARGRFAFTLLAPTLGGADGLELFRQLRSQGGQPGPILVTLDTRDLSRAPEATALGAADVLQKSVRAAELENALKDALARPPVAWGPAGPGGAPSAGPDGDEAATRLRREVALWTSPQMRALAQIVEQAARVDVTVLIGGETGTGKDLVARALHHFSARRDHPFVKVNCAAMPRELLESELFGHERGAFTGAHQTTIGKFEAANRGTIFLDEIGDLHPALQAKLLHVLQDGSFSRVGGQAVLKVDVRILAASNRDLERAVAAGEFREDLFFRLNVVQIVVPPLRERMDEVPRLAGYFAERYARAFHRDGFVLSPVAVERLMRHRYPGNIRELENLVQRMIVLDDPTLSRIPLPASPGNGASPAAAPEAPRPAAGGAVSLKEIARAAARAAEREAMARVLEQTSWNRVRAAKLLRISYRALLYKIKDVGLDRVVGPSS